MFSFSRINCVVAKQNLHNQTLKLFLNGFRRNDKIASFSSLNVGVRNRCKYTKSVVPLNESLLSLYSEKKNIISSRYFSSSNTLCSWMQSNQDKERLQNYLFLGAITLSVIFVLYMLATMEYHQDYVYIEPSDKKK